jgi:hypothetical protein
MPFSQVPSSPNYTVWFASWTTERPAADPNNSPPFVVCCTTGQAPQGATVLGSSIKDPIPPPPPPFAVIKTSDYQLTLESWLAAGRSL